MVRSASSAVLVFLLVALATPDTRAAEPSSAPARLEQVFLELHGMG